MYPGSRAGYHALLRLRPVLEMFNTEDALGSFDIQYTFPSINYEEDGNVDSDYEKRCYARGYQCSVGFLDGRIIV